MRLYLRTGRIKIVNEDLKEKIMKKEQLHLVQITELRRMIAEEIKRILIASINTAKNKPKNM